MCLLKFLIGLVISTCALAGTTFSRIIESEKPFVAINNFEHLKSNALELTDEFVSS